MCPPTSVVRASEWLYTNTLASLQHSCAFVLVCALRCIWNSNDDINRQWRRVTTCVCAMYVYVYSIFIVNVAKLSTIQKTISMRSWLVLYYCTERFLFDIIYWQIIKYSSISRKRLKNHLTVLSYTKLTSGECLMKPKEKEIIIKYEKPRPIAF